MRPASLHIIPLLLVVCVLLLPGVVEAQTTVSLPTLEGMTGQRIGTDLRLENAPGVTGITIDIVFNANLVTPDTDLTMGDLGMSIDNIHGANVIGADTLRIAVSVADEIGYLGSGVLATIDWDLNAPGFTQLTFVRALLENNESPPPISTSVVNGLLTITGDGGGGNGECPCPVDEPRVLLSSTTGESGDRVSVDIDVQLLPQNLDAFGLKVNYDTTVLRYIDGSGRCVGLTEDWFSCSAAESAPGVVTVGGFNTSQVPAGSTGSLARLDFDVICIDCNEGDVIELTVSDLVDDLAGMQVCCGTFTTSQQCLSDGDVNSDGILSPGDAQCAFNTFFNNQTIPAECDVDSGCEVIAADVNCDRQATPGDALAIFSRWLENGLPLHCFNEGGAPRNDGGSVMAGAAGAVMLYRLDDRGLDVARAGRVEVPLIMRALPGSSAFGVVVEFDTERFAFQDFDVAGVARDWTAIRARQIEPGRLVVGGYDHLGLRDADARKGGEVVLGTLTFEKLDATPAAFEQIDWRERFIQKAPSLEEGVLSSPSGYRLGGLYPNPTRTGIAGSLVVPVGGDQPVRVAVYDVQGRHVRAVLDEVLPVGFHQVEWDRSNASGTRVGPGIYFMRMTAGDFSLTRKVTVIE